MHSIPRIPDNDFLRLQTEWLELQNNNNADGIDLVTLRIWLAQAPSRLEQTSLAIWTSLTGVLVLATEKDAQCNPLDGPLIKQLLDHALTIPMHVWLAEGKSLVQDKINPDYLFNAENDDSDFVFEARPAYDELRSLFSLLSWQSKDAGPHSLFMATLALGWQPGPLLSHLDSVREIQMLQAENARASRTDTAQGFLLESCLSAMAISDWRPAPHNVWGMLWDTGIHAYYTDDDIQYRPIDEQRKRALEQRKASAAVLAHFPEYTGLALRSYLNGILATQVYSYGQDVSAFIGCLQYYCNTTNFSIVLDKPGT